ncbi:MAG: glycoside hydrolase family 43 protein [Oscillospiraceae bacterium]|nr:glycoside hydrolase family 43 protein [Oscillospiraceae bacterium]
MLPYENPIIKGYNPDPSICRAGEDYYLVTSSFEYFPGVPVYHSRNLANWTLIGHCLTRKEQLELDVARPSGGIYAPTLRYHNGTFYMTTTNVSHKGNLIVTADNPAGPWSDPVWIEQGGIDPDLFFDDDGTVYFTSTAPAGGRHGISICTLDPETLRQKTETVFLTEGGGGRFAEAPHLFKKDGMVYLMLAEGGTEYGHMVTFFRSAAAAGPYEPCPHNPVLTHRGRAAQHNPIQCAGHADLLEDHNGNWWMVALGVRTLPGVMLHNLGRETFLAPVTWEDGWPAVRDGMLKLSMSGPLPGAPWAREKGFSDDFTSDKPDYLYVRNPEPGRYVRDAQSKTLTLRGNGVSLREKGLSAREKEAAVPPPVFLGVRQTEFELTAKAEVTASSDIAKGGLAAWYGPDYHYVIYLTRYGGVTYARTACRVHGMEVKSDRVPIYGDSATLCIITGKDYYSLCYTDGAGSTVELARGATAGLCTEGTATMTFTGTLLGMFAERGEVVFGEFTVKPL